MGGGWRYTQRQPLLTTCRLQALDHPGVYLHPGYRGKGGLEWASQAQTARFRPLPC